MTQAAQLAQYGSNNVGLSFKNRIINGDMTIDQRNNGAAVTVNSSGSNFFFVDRWFGNGQNSDGVFTAQRVSTAPVGFNNSLQFTVTTADSSIGATQGYTFRQRVEGFNFADMMWGTASAQTVTLSFWVRSSLTGNFGGSIFNENGDRIYVFPYTINSANTFEYKTITILGDTTGTWVGATNGVALNLTFSLGVGSTFKGTAGAWSSTFAFAPTGSVDLISTNGATLFITGVQIEKGTVATSFDYLPYTTELLLCQRYYQKQSVATYGCSDGSNTIFNGTYVTKRASPTNTFTTNFSIGGGGADVDGYGIYSFGVANNRNVTAVFSSAEL